MVLSMRAYFLIPICAYLLAGMLREFQDVEWCLKTAGVAFIAVALLGVYQYTLPRNHWLNRYDFGDEDGKVTFTAGHVRAVGTFSYMGGMSRGAVFATWCGMVLALPLPQRTYRTRMLGLATIAAGLTMASVAMSRSGFLFSCAVIAGSLLLFLRFSDILVLLFFAVLAVITIGTNDETFETSVRDSNALTSGLIHRLEYGDSIGIRLLYMFDNLVLGLSNHPVGEGIGTGQPGGTYAYTGSRQSETLYYESEWGRIAFEVGVLGLAAVLFIRFVTLNLCWRGYRTVRDLRQRLILSTVIPYFGIMSLGWMAFNHISNTFSWSAMSVALGALTWSANRRAPSRSQPLKPAAGPKSTLSMKLRVPT
jgi:hypothetical protein